MSWASHEQPQSLMTLDWILEKASLVLLQRSVELPGSCGGLLMQGSPAVDRTLVLYWGKPTWIVRLWL